MIEPVSVPILINVDTSPKTYTLNVDNTCQADLAIDTRVVVNHISGEIYDGSYEVTPSEETQILQTAQKSTIHDIVINPIPSNYGRIEWNGSVLTIV